MEIGTGIAIAGIVFSFVMLLYRVVPPREANGFSKRCSDHAMIAQEMANVKDWLEKIENKLDKVIEKL